MCPVGVKVPYGCTMKELSTMFMKMELDWPEKVSGSDCGTEKVS